MLLAQLTDHVTDMPGPDDHTLSLPESEITEGGAAVSFGAGPARKKPVEHRRDV